MTHTTAADITVTDVANTSADVRSQRQMKSFASGSESDKSNDLKTGWMKRSSKPQLNDTR